MPERKILTTITCITDHETGMYSMGEVEAGFQHDDLVKLIETHGSESLLNALAYLTYQAIQAKREVNRRKHCTPLANHQPNG